MKIDPIRAGLALFVVVIVYLTLYPFALSAIPQEGLSWRVPSNRGEWMDALLNYYFFLPFGLFGGLLVPGWRGVLWTGLGGALLSYTVESIQLYIPMRDGSYRDILLNTIGALSGAGGMKAAGTGSASRNSGVVRRGNFWSAAPNVSWPGIRLLHDPSTVRSPREIRGLGIWFGPVPTSAPHGPVAEVVFAT